MSDNLATWLSNQLSDRGWSMRELARRSGSSHSWISNVISGKVEPSWDFCASIAKTFGTDPVEVFRIADLLPPSPPVEEEIDLVHIFRNLPSGVRHLIVQMLRGLRLDISLPPSQIALAELRSPYQVSDLQYEIKMFLQQFPELTDIIQEAVTRGLSEPGIRALMINVRIFAESKEDRGTFSKLHRQLSDILSQIEATG